MRGQRREDSGFDRYGGHATRLTCVEGEILGAISKEEVPPDDDDDGGDAAYHPEGQAEFTSTFPPPFDMHQSISQSIYSSIGELTTSLAYDYIRSSSN